MNKKEICTRYEIIKSENISSNYAFLNKFIDNLKNLNTLNTYENLNSHEIFLHKFDENNNKYIYKIPIHINTKFPHYFIQNHKYKINYRISTSFDYLNKIWDIKIKIIRDIKKIKNIIIKFTDLLEKNIHKFYNDIIFLFEENLPDNKKHIFYIINFYYKNEFFHLVYKNYEGEVGISLIYFGKDFYNIEEFLDYLEKIKE